MLTLVLAVLPFGHQVRAATLVVDDDHLQCPTATFTSINAAIAAASPGDTIQVCPGTYNEQVNINKNDLKLRGAQAGINATTRGFNPAAEAIVQDPCGPMQIEADRDVIDGFTVQGSTLNPTVFFGCFGAGIWTNPGFSGTQGGHQILNNIIQNNITGIELDSTCLNATLAQFNLIQNNSNPGAGEGNGIQTNFGLCNATIDANTFSGDTSTSILVEAPSSGLRITNNDLVAGTPERIFLAVTTDSSITGNLSTGSTSSGTIRLFSGNANIRIDGNTLLNGMRGIRVDDLDPLMPAGNSNITAHQNCIKGNAIAGLEVAPGDHTGVLDATLNWWGDASGPFETPRNMFGLGDKIIDVDQNVAFDPWLKAPPGPPARQCPIPPPPPNTPGKATGGGYIQPADGTSGGGIGGIQPLDVVVELAEMLILQSSNPQSVNSKANFGFVATCCAPRGNLEYNDHGSNVRIKATSVTNFTITDPSPVCPTGKHAQFRGDANQTNANGTVVQVKYTVDVDDCAEPGSSPGSGPDTFRIETTGGYMAGGPLVGGNIQIHKS